MGYTSKREDDIERSQRDLFKPPLKEIVRSQEYLAHVNDLREAIATCDKRIQKLKGKNQALRKRAIDEQNSLEQEVDKNDQLRKSLKQRVEGLRNMRDSITIGERLDTETRHKMQQDFLPRPLDSPELISPDEVREATFVDDDNYYHYIRSLRDELKKRHNRITLLNKERSSLEQCVDDIEKQTRSVCEDNTILKKRIAELDEDTKDGKRKYLKNRMEKGGYLHDSFRRGHKPDP